VPNFTAAAGLVEIRRRISHHWKMIVPNFTAAAGVVETRRRILQHENDFSPPMSSHFSQGINL
jgi:hypothetical protein